MIARRTLFVFGMLLALVGSASAEVYTVNSLLDDGSLGTLRYGITGGAYSDIYFDPSLVSGGPATISLTSTYAGTPTSAFYITSPLDIHGLAGLTISGNATETIPGTFRLFTVYNTSLTLSDLAITNFNATGFTGGTTERCSGGGGALGAGGAIFANQATLSIDSVTFTGNAATGGAGGAGGGSSTSTSATGPGGGGMGSTTTTWQGGLANDPTGIGHGANGSGSSLPTPAVFGGGGGGRRGSSSYVGGAGGFGGGGGGGAKVGPNNGGAAGFGGGHGGAGTQSYHGGGGGGAGMGGAIFMLGGSATITNSTFDGNSAIKGLGSGYVNGQDGQGLGGAIFNADGVLSVTDTTFSGNAAAQGATGIYGYAGTTGVGGVGTTGSVTLTNTPGVTIQNGTGARNSTDMVWTENNAPLPASLTIKKFFDCDQSGTRNYADDNLLPNWTYHITGPGGYDQTLTTDGAGQIALTGLDPGDYTVTETVKKDHTITTGNQGVVITLAGGDDKTELFGNILPGDINQDGTVDSVDFTILKASYGLSPKTWTQGNLNPLEDAAVDSVDFTILKAYYGQGVPPGPGAVPEPASLTLLLIGALGLLRRRR